MEQECQKVCKEQRFRVSGCGSKKATPVGMAFCFMARLTGFEPVTPAFGG